MPNWRKLVVSGSDASFSSLNVSNTITTSIVSASQFTGSLFGTATTASYVKLLQGPNITITYQSDGIAISGSAGGGGGGGADNLIVNGNNIQLRSGSVVLSTITVPFATNSFTASFVTSSNVYGPFGSNSILTSSYAITASFIDGGTFN